MPSAKSAQHVLNARRIFSISAFSHQIIPTNIWPTKSKKESTTDNNNNKAECDIKHHNVVPYDNQEVLTAKDQN